MAAAIMIVLVLIYSKMGRTIPSFRTVLAMEEERGWKTFHNALEGSDKKKFNEMFDIRRFYLSLLMLYNP